MLTDIVARMAATRNVCTNLRQWLSLWKNMLTNQLVAWDAYMLQKLILKHTCQKLTSDAIIPSASARPSTGTVLLTTNSGNAFLVVEEIANVLMLAERYEHL